MELRHYLRMLQSGWWLIALSMLSALIITLSISFVTVPQYRASARFIVSPNPALRNSNEILYSLDTLDRRSVVVTYNELLNSRSIFTESGARIELAPDALAAYSYQAVVLPEANVMTLDVTGPDPRITAMLANTMGEQGIEYSAQLYQNIYDLNFLDRAETPTTPISPQPLRDAGLSLILGAALGAVLAVMREQITNPLSMLQHSRSIDPASSVYTQRAFLRILTDEILQRRTPVVSLGLVHLDGLRDFLETQPQPVIKQLLARITQTLRNELRGNDQIGRWNETSFSVILPNTSEMAAERTMNRICRALSTTITLDTDNITVNLHPYAGVAVRGEDESMETLINQTEEALYQARHADRLVVLYQRAVTTNATASMERL